MSSSTLAFLDGTSSSSGSARARFALLDFCLDTGAAATAVVEDACLVLVLVVCEDAGLEAPVSTVEATFLRGGIGKEWITTGWNRRGLNTHPYPNH